MTIDPTTDDALRHAASQARDNAYAPYSRFHVGAAVRTLSGAIYRGANMENASYGLTTCAEVAALAAAVSAGDFRCEAIAVVGGPAGPADPDQDVTRPCGRCRQLIAEAAAVSGVDIRVISANAAATKIVVEPISDLLPHAFALPQSG